MAENSKIEWTNHTFNPWLGCTKISPACDHCYAEAWAKRTGDAALWQGERRRTSAANWRQPLKWNRQAAERGVHYRVFCASLADVFDNAVPDQWRADLFALIRSTPALDWLLLTKRIGNAWSMSQHAMWGSGKHPGMHALPDNVWLGATIANQQEADRDIPKLLATPARVRFLSMEPLLGEVDLERGGFTFLRRLVSPSSGVVHERGVDWVIVGGESGKRARPMKVEWARSLRDQCAAAGVPFFFKQGSETWDWPWFKDFDTFPADLRVREFPTTTNGERP